MAFRYLSVLVQSSCALEPRKYPHRVYFLVSTKYQRRAISKLGVGYVKIVDFLSFLGLCVFLSLSQNYVKSISNNRSQKTWLRFTFSLHLRIHIVMKCENWLQNALKLMQTSYISIFRNILIYLNVNAW